MRTDRIEKLESRTREAHRAAWSAFWARFRSVVDGLPSGAFERFIPLELADYPDLEPELLLWERWSGTILPVLSKAEQGDLGAWPADLPRPPSDPRPLLLEVISRWRANSRLPAAALLVLLCLGAAAEGEGVPLRYGDEHAET